MRKAVFYVAIALVSAALVSSSPAAPEREAGAVLKVRVLSTSLTTALRTGTLKLALEGGGGVGLDPGGGLGLTAGIELSPQRWRQIAPVAYTSRAKFALPLSPRGIALLSERGRARIRVIAWPRGNRGDAIKVIAVLR